MIVKEFMSIFDKNNYFVTKDEKTKRFVAHNNAGQVFPVEILNFNSPCYSLTVFTYDSIPDLREAYEYTWHNSLLVSNICTNKNIPSNVLEQIRHGVVYKNVGRKTSSLPTYIVSQGYELIPSARNSAGFNFSYDNCIFVVPKESDAFFEKNYYPRMQNKKG